MRDRGFTLLELVVILAVLAILAAAVTPTVVSQIMDTRVEATRAETKALYAAIVGAEGSSGTEFGFVGDIGRAPTALTELVTRGSLPVYGTGTFRNVGMGWRGPYINTGTSVGDYLTDSFGRNYTLSGAQVRSDGPDGVAGNADDIVYPPSAPVLTGNATITVKELQGQKIVVDQAGYRVDLYFAISGVESSVNDPTGPYTFTNVPLGIHAVRVVKTINPGAGSVVAQDTIVVRPGSTTTAELWF